MKDDIIEESCLIKNTHHIKGRLILNKKYEYNKNQKFELIFKQYKTRLVTCNNNFTKEENINESLCYGSTFACPNKEYNRAIIIKSKTILFILFRIYFHRLSAIEIFTINKSYYFNFFEPFEINNLKKNNILHEIQLNPNFKEIKLKKDKIILGFYNIMYQA